MPVFAVLPALAGLALAPALVLGAAAPREGAPVLVIAPGAAAVVEAAGGQLVGLSRAPLAVLAAADAPGFAARLRAAGAWSVHDGERLAVLCGAGS